MFISGPCWHEESLENVCKEITGDIPLQTLIKGKLEICSFIIIDLCIYTEQNRNVFH